MVTTDHMRQRMKQRGIDSEMIDLVLQFGSSEGDKFLLNRKNIDRLLMEFRKVAQSLEKMKARGGVCVVSIGESLITTYDLNSYKRSKRKVVSVRL